MPQDLNEDFVQRPSCRGNQQLTVSYSVPTESKLLRPMAKWRSRIDQPSENIAEQDHSRNTYRILYLKRTEELWNETAQSHCVKYSCAGYLKWDHKGEIKRGLGWKEK